MKPNILLYNGKINPLTGELYSMGNSMWLYISLTIKITSIENQCIIVSNIFMNLNFTDKICDKRLEHKTGKSDSVSNQKSPLK